MKRPALIMASALSLAACSTLPPAAPPGGSAKDGPSAVAGLDWFLTDDPAETKLAYGRANSDDFRFSMTCVPGSGQLDLIQATEDDATAIMVESGGDTERLAATSEPAGVVEGVVLIASSATANPVFLRFRSLGWLATWQGQTREVLAAHPGTLPSIDRFFAVCG